MHTAILEKSGLFRTIFPACALVEMSRTFWLYLISFETVCFILSTLWLPISGLSINYCRHLRILTYCTKWNISIFRFKQLVSPDFLKKSRKLPRRILRFPPAFHMNPYSAATLSAPECTALISARFIWTLGMILFARFQSWLSLFCTRIGSVFCSESQ